MCLSNRFASWTVLLLIYRSPPHPLPGAPERTAGPLTPGCLPTGPHGLHGPHGGSAECPHAPCDIFRGPRTPADGLGQFFQAGPQWSAGPVPLTELQAQDLGRDRTGPSEQGQPSARPWQAPAGWPSPSVTPLYQQPSSRHVFPTLICQGPGFPRKESLRSYL